MAGEGPSLVIEQSFIRQAGTMNAPYQQAPGSQDSVSFSVSVIIRSTRGRITEHQLDLSSTDAPATAFQKLQTLYRKEVSRTRYAFYRAVLMYKPVIKLLPFQSVRISGSFLLCAVSRVVELHNAVDLMYKRLN